MIVKKKIKNFFFAIKYWINHPIYITSKQSNVKQHEVVHITTTGYLVTEVQLERTARRMNVTQQQIYAAWKLQYIQGGN